MHWYQKQKSFRKRGIGYGLNNKKKVALQVEKKTRWGKGGKDMLSTYPRYFNNAARLTD